MGQGMHKILNLVALDPGGTTGIARTMFNKTDGTCGKVYVDELGGAHHKLLWDFLCKESPDVIIYERFTHQNRQSNDAGAGIGAIDLVSREYIGVARLYAQLTSKKTAPQMPDTGKKLWPDRKVRGLDLWHPGMPHAMDATRHLLYFVTQTLKCNYFIVQLRRAGVI